MSSREQKNGSGSASRRRKGSPLPVSFLEKTKKKGRDLEPPPTSESLPSGPIYEETGSSFVLKSTCVKNVGDKWDKEKNPNGIVPVVVHPKLVTGLDPEKPKELTEEQREGVQFLWDCYESGQGGILAHDMGLGKTRTGVTFVATLLEQSKNSSGKSSPGMKKCLVIAPKNAISVWHSEFDLWVPHDILCNVVVVRPGQGDGWTAVNEFMQPNSLKNIMIVSYETFMKYNSGYEEGFNKKNSKGEIGVVICDEAHVLKNQDTARVKNLRKFLSADLWVGFTGTPYQNSLEELCHLVSFFRRDIFQSGQINKLCKPITDALRKNKKLGVKEKQGLIYLRDMLVPALHFKKNTLSVERHSMILCVPLDGHPHYGKQIGDVDKTESENLEGVESREEDENLGIQHELYRCLTECLHDSEITFFEKLSYLEKACIHPTKLYEAVQKNQAIFSKVITAFDNWISKEDLANPEVKIRLPIYSAKIKVVAHMAQFLYKESPDEKMIIVSSSTVLLGMVKSYLNDFLKMKVVVFDGDTSEYARERNLKLFETDENYRFLLLSLKAGGTALTLTRANHLVLMDPDYNPANDKQAIARIYRPSQERTAFIYRLLATGTLEEVKFTRQLEKEDMEQVFQPDGSTNVQTMYDEKELLEYNSKDESRLRRLLDRLVNSLNKDDLDVSLAAELRECPQYTEIHQVPENLKLVRKIWDQVSYAFHIAKVPEEAQSLVLANGNP